jgi:hypothetical protein
MPQKKLIPKAWRITPEQDAFIKRKVKEIRRQVPDGGPRQVNESAVVQGLIDYWMAVDAGRKTSQG